MAFGEKAFVSAVSRKKRRLPENLPFHKMLVQRSGKVAVWTGKVAGWTGKIAVSIQQATACIAQLAKVSFRTKSAVSMENIVFNQTAEKCTRQEATGMGVFPPNVINPH